MKITITFASQGDVQAANSKSQVSSFKFKYTLPILCFIFFNLQSFSQGLWQANWLDLGNIATLQQKSIEEIILYLVDMKKEMMELKEKNTMLETEIQKLKK